MLGRFVFIFNILYLVGQWQAWRMWSACSKTCGHGIRTRTRTCDFYRTPKYRRSCSGSSSQTEICKPVVQCPG